MGTPTRDTRARDAKRIPCALLALKSKLDPVSTERTEASQSGACASSRSEARRPAFVTTHWSVVVAAGGGGGAQAQEALARLCETYWYPLYAYVRRRGYSPEDAQDMTQEFFARLLARNWVGSADPQKGRFRTFLLTAMSRFLANEWDKVRSLKRGGALRFVSLDWAGAETRYGTELADPSTPEQAFERRWALTLLDEVLDQLEVEYGAQGKAELFAALKPCLVGDSATLSYQELAHSLRLSEGGVRVAVHRLRQRYRELLRCEIANTVVSADEVDAEMRHLFNVLARK